MAHNNARLVTSGQILGAIDQGLTQFNVFALAWSDAAAKSQWVRTEMDAAVTRWTENSVAGIAALLGAVFVVKNLLALARIRGTLAFTYGMWRQWVERIVRNVVHGPVLTTEAQKPGALLSISLTQSLGSIGGIRQLFEFGVSILTLTCIYFMLWLVSWPITLGLTVLFVIFTLFGLRPLTQSAHAAGACLVRGNEDSSTTLLETIGGIRYVKAFCQERQFEERIHKAVDGVQKSLISIYWLRALVHPLMETSVVLLFCVAVIIAGRNPGWPKVEIRPAVVRNKEDRNSLPSRKHRH